eukprot:770521-Amphidinium_carterae.1
MKKKGWRIALHSFEAKCELSRRKVLRIAQVKTVSLNLRGSEWKEIDRRKFEHDSLVDALVCSEEIDGLQAKLDKIKDDKDTEGMLPQSGAQKAQSRVESQSQGGLSGLVSMVFGGGGPELPPSEVTEEATKAGGVKAGEKKPKKGESGVDDSWKEEENLGQVDTRRQSRLSTGHSATRGMPAVKRTCQDCSCLEIGKMDVEVQKLMLTASKNSFLGAILEISTRVAGVSQTWALTQCRFKAEHNDAKQSIFGRNSWRLFAVKTAAVFKPDKHFLRSR